MKTISLTYPYGSYSILEKKKGSLTSEYQDCQSTEFYYKNLR